MLNRRDFVWGAVSGAAAMTVISASGEPGVKL